MRPVRLSLGCAWHRNGSVLLWTPVLLLSPALSLHGGGALIAFQVALIAVLAGTAVTVVLTSHRRDSSPAPYATLSVLVAATVAGASQGSAWLPTWTLLALTVPSVLRGWWLGLALPAVAAGSMWAAWYAGPASVEQVGSVGLVVLLAGVANTVILKLIETVAELRRTREELARRAVSEERERFSRDLHDLLGHSLSVMVVKAQAVRRLVERDPAAAAVHAEDVERVGREALVGVREAVDAMRAPSLDDELDGARRALDAAGIRAEVTGEGTAIPDQVEELFAWVVREGTTNVLRHSGASRCRFEVANGDGRLTLTVTDDGAGGPAVQQGRQGGLDGLRHRLVAAGGRLDVDPDAEGFRLTAQMPLGQS